ncbi:MAG: alpha/beta hydrolase [Halobacteria archaeon]|nr:alpha/beta hydrolase [Halobacteria archaeon]
MKKVTHGGRDTAYRYSDLDRGDYPPVLCIHGSGGTHEIWKSQLTRLSKERPIVALDLSGHGDSEDIENGAEENALAEYTEDVLAVARDTGARVLMGNSLGGAVTLNFALEKDYRLEGLVLAGTGAKLAVLDDLRDWLRNDFDRAVDFLHDENMLFHHPDERYLEFSKGAMYDAGWEVTRRDFLTCHRFDVRERLDEIEIPSLAVVGEHDQLTPVWYHEYLAENIPDCDLSVIKDAAHLAMIEQPDQFNAVVSEFLDSL